MLCLCHRKKKGGGKIVVFVVVTLKMRRMRPREKRDLPR